MKGGLALDADHSPPCLMTPKLPDAINVDRSYGFPVFRSEQNRLCAGDPSTCD
jgi:hypothetical protein